MYRTVEGLLIGAHDGWRVYGVGGFSALFPPVIQGICPAAPGKILRVGSQRRPQVEHPQGGAFGLIQPVHPTKTAGDSGSVFFRCLSQVGL